jgi:aspartate/methionine/tyrosine aminotransferase
MDGIEMGAAEKASRHLGTYLHSIYNSKVQETIGDQALDCSRRGVVNDNPYYEVMRAGSHGLLKGKGLLDYIRSNSHEGQPLAAILREFNHRNHFVDLEAAYRELWKNEHKNPVVAAMNFEDYLQYCADKTINLGPYTEDREEDNSSVIDQDKAIAASYFRSTGIPATMDEVGFTGDGFKAAYWGLVGATTMRINEETGIYESIGGEMLIPSGSYSSLKRAISVAGGHLTPIEGDYPAAIEDILHNARGDLRLIYISTVSNPLGMVPTKDYLCRIAKPVLEYNRRHPEDPVYVLADEVYNHSVLEHDLKTHSMGAIDGKELGDVTLGRMHDWTVTITSTSKSFSGAQQRFGMYTSGRGDLVKRIGEILGMIGSGTVAPPTELMGVANFALTPRVLIEQNNAYYRGQLEYALQRMSEINSKYRAPIVELYKPQGGWFCSLQIKTSLLPEELRSSDELVRFMGLYGESLEGTGIRFLPGSIFGLEGTDLPLDGIRSKYQMQTPGYLYLRSSLAVDREFLGELFRRLEEAIEQLARISPA